jgi:PAS domain S-box-containing protein
MQRRGSSEIDLERRIAWAILELIHEESSLATLMKGVAEQIGAFVQGAEIVWRVRVNGAFPCFVIGEGGEVEQVESELCLERPWAETRDSEMCLCRALIDREVDLTRPCFTERGSFFGDPSAAEGEKASLFGDDDFELLCPAHRHETLLIIPLQRRTETFGLLYICGLSHDSIGPEEVSFLEHVADILALGLARHYAEDERRRSARIARAEQDKLQAMLEGMAEGVLIADEQGVITNVNSRLLELVRRPREDVLGRRISDLHTSEVMKTIDSVIAEMRRGGVGVPSGVVINRELMGRYVSLRLEPIVNDGRYGGRPDWSSVPPLM